MADLNNLYLKYPELWQVDNGWNGFKWIDVNNDGRSVISYRRIAENGHELIVALNFTPSTYEDNFLRVPCAGIYEEIFNSDDERYGGSGVTNKGASFDSFAIPESEGYTEGIRMRLPPLGASIIRLVKKIGREEAQDDKKPKRKSKTKTAKPQK